MFHAPAAGGSSTKKHGKRDDREGGAGEEEERPGITTISSASLEISFEFEVTVYHGT